MNQEKLTHKIYEKLVNDEDSRACKAIPDEACQEVPGNFVVTLCSLFLTKLADAILNPKITLPWLLQSLGAPAWMLGWLVPIRESGSMLPQLALGSIVRRMPVRKWMWVLGSVLQAGCVAAIALVAINLNGATAGAAILALLIIFSLSRGLNSIAFKDVVGKTIPKQRRGSLSGWASALAGLITMMVAALMFSGILGQGSAQLYAAGFAGAAGLWLFAATLYATIKEYPGATDGGKNGLSEAIQRLSLIKNDKHFQHFVTTRALMLCSALSAPFIVVMAQRHLDNSLGLLALFMAASGLASLVSAPFWGRFADNSSRLVMVNAGLLTATVGLVIVGVSIWFSSLLNLTWLLPFLYFVLSIAHQGVRLGRKTYVVNMAEGNQRTDYVSVSNTLIGGILLLTGLISALEPLIGISGLIFILSMMGLIGSWMAAQLPEVE